MLRARDVWNEAEERREKRMAAMRPVLAQIQSQIRKQSIHAPASPYIVFEIPEYVFGYPLYQLSEARGYLQETLQGAGYLVWPVNEKYLLISWMKQSGGAKTAFRPPLTTNYRPSVYDPSLLNSMLMK